MKRTLSLFLSFVLMLSMVFSTTSINVFAEVTGGAFANNAGEVVKEYIEDFDTWRNEYWSALTANSTTAFDTQSNQQLSVSTRSNEVGGSNARKSMPSEIITKVGTTDKFLRVKEVSGDGIHHGRFYFNLNSFQHPVAGEKMFLSIDLKSDDSNHRKLFGVSKHLNTDVSRDVKRIIEFSSDGDIKMFDTTVVEGYTEGQWYQFDMLWDNGSVECYVDNVLKTTVTKDLTTFFYHNADTTYNKLGFWITNKANNNTVLYAPDSEAASLDIDNLAMMFYDDSVVIDSVPSITSVGTDNTISYDATEVEFTLDGELPGLKAEHIRFTPDNSASAISVTSDGSGNTTVTATLTDELLPWTNYTVEIDKAAFNGKYILGTNDFPVPVANITGEFDVTPAPFSLKSPEFSVSGTTLTAETTFVNNTQDAKWAYFMLVTKDASGVVTNIITESKKDITTGANGETVTLTAPNFAEGSAKLFVIDGYTDEPLFDVSYGYNYDESEYAEDAPVASTVASSGEMVLGRFDYTNKEITVDLNAGSDAADKNGVLYIYKRGTTMKDNLIYADFITTANDGSLKKTIVFPDDINDTTGEYTVSFVVNGTDISKDFAIYDNDAAFGGNVVKAGLDTVGVKYDSYSDKLAVWDLTKIAIAKAEDDETAFSLTYPSKYAADQGSMRISISPVGGRKLTGRQIVKFKFMGDKADSNGYVDFERGYLTVNRDTKSSFTDGSYTIDGVVKANKWYDIEIVFDIDAATPKSTINVVDIETGENVMTDSLNIVNHSDGILNGFKNIWAYLTYTANDDGYQMVFKDIQMLEDYGDQKSVIRYVGNDGMVDYGQSEVEFKISEDNGLTADDVCVKDSQGNVIKAKSIEVTEDMGEYVVTATLEKDLASWQIYTLMVDALGYEDYRELQNGKYVPVSPISRDFATPAAPVDITDPIITSDGSNVTFEADITNSTSSRVDATTILAVVSSDGIMQSVTTDSDIVTSTKTFTNTNGFAAGNRAEYFVIKGFDNPVPLFAKTWSLNYDGTIPAPEVIVASNKAQAKTIVLDKYEYDTEFDHLNKKVVVNLNTGVNEPIDGVLYIYSGDALNAGNVVYANYVTTANDGTLLKEIKFDPSVVNTTKEYTVAFYSNDVAEAIEESFDIYKAADYLNYKRNNIFENVKKATTFSGIQQVITGTDDMGNTTCDAWTVFSGDADVSVYNTLSKKEAVFVNLSTKAASLTNYDALCDTFEALASAQKNAELNPKPAGPSSNNKTPGSSSVNMSATPSSKPADDSTSASGGSVFTDMNGHWGQKYAEALVERGIVNGYADGSFRGDSPITRAELTKIVVEALNVPANGNKSFGDISADSWYADYVSRAATAGVVNGFEDGRFAPEANVTRQDAVLMIYRAMKLSQELPEGFKFFADEKDIQDYASDAIRCLGDLGIITGNGNDNQFLPNNNITRAEMAAVVCRALDYMESHMQ